MTKGESIIPANSKVQQKAEGAALSAKRGTKVSELQGASETYDSMSEEELEDMASTERKGKPEHKDD